MPLTAENVDKLTAQLEEANRRLEETRKSMDEKQKEISAALDRMKALEKQNTDGGSERDVLKQKLEGLATDVTRIAEQHTNLLTQLRTTTARLAQSGDAPEKAYTYPSGNGSIFASRRQAMELGYFLMGTCVRGESRAKQYAQRWLREHAGDLRYLPRVPKDLIQVLGQSVEQVVKACYGQGLHYGAEALVGNVMPGSVLVAPQFADMLVRNIERYGVFRQNALVWPMGSSMVRIPRRTAGMTCYWEDEATAPSDTAPSFDLLELIAKKLIGLYYCSSELGEDENAAVALADIVVDEFAVQMAYKEDLAGLIGTGTSTYAGFVGVLGLTAQSFTATPDLDKAWGVTGAANLDRTDEITLKSMRNMVSLMPARFRTGAKWFGHRTVNGDLLAIETSAGGPIIGQNEAVQSFLRYPLVDADVMPAGPAPGQSTKTFCYANLRRAYMLGDRRRFEVQTSEDFLFSTDQLATRATERCGIKLLDGTAIVLYTTGTT